MARKKSMASIETEIKKVQTDLEKAQELVDLLSKKLLALEKEKREREAQEIMAAFLNSNKSLSEILTFLGA